MKSFLAITLLTALSVLSYGQSNTGTLKVFSEITGITVFVDEVQQANYQDITGLAVGTHYVRIINSSDIKIYGQVITILKDAVTTILIERSGEEKALERVAVPVVEQPSEKQLTSAPGATGTINVFSELTGVIVYLNEARQGEDIKTINSVPAGDHYLKVLKDGVSIFGEIVSVKPGQVSTVLIKNNGQVQEKIMETKTPEREEYQNSKIDVILTSNSISSTVGASNMFPGFYGYYGYNKSVTTSTQITDFKIIKGGVQEIGEHQLANLVDNQAIIQKMANVEAGIVKQTTIGALVFLSSLAIGTPLLIDMLGEKHFLHKNTPTHPDWETGVLATVIITGTISYGVTMVADKRRPAHYYTPEEANKDAQKHNKKLKEKLGLPESYDIK